jgi:hypothetical protein
MSTVNLEEEGFPNSINVEAPVVQETAARGQPKCKQALMLPLGTEALSHVPVKGHWLAKVIPCVLLQTAPQVTKATEFLPLRGVNFVS